MFLLNESTYCNFSACEVQYIFYKFMAEKCLLSLIRSNILTKGIFFLNNCIFSLGELPMVPGVCKGTFTNSRSIYNRLSSGFLHNLKYRSGGKKPVFLLGALLSERLEQATVESAHKTFRPC